MIQRLMNSGAKSKANWNLKKRIQKLIQKTLWAPYLFMAQIQIFATDDLIPSQLSTTATNIKNAFTGDLAKTIMGIFFVGSCIAYGYNKDNEKMKAKALAVGLASLLIALSQTLVTNFWKMGGAS